MRCGDPTNEQQIDQRTKEVLEMLYLQQDKSDEIHLNFFTITSSLQSSYFAGSSKKDIWEKWVLPVRLVSSDHDPEKGVQKLLMKVVEEADGDHVPPIYEGMKCYQFELDHLKPSSKAPVKASSSFFGGLLGKFTGK